MQIKNLSQEYIDKIVSVAYGDAGFIDEIKIYLEARKNPEVKKLLNEYRQTAKEVRSLKNEIYTGGININTKSSNLFLTVLGSFIRRPALSAAFTFMLIAGISSYYIITSNSTEYKYTQTEIIKAENDLNTSLSIVNEYFMQTSNTVENNVIKEKINEPIGNSISVLNTYLKGG